MTGKPTSKWGSLGRRVADLKDGENIVLESDDPRKEVKKIRDGLNGIKACYLVRRSVKIVDGKIVITRMGNPADAGRVISTVALMSRPETYSTPEAAKLMGVSLITLHRWLAAGKLQPFGIELGDGRKLWRWNERDITEGRKLKASIGAKSQRKGSSLA